MGELLVKRKKTKFIVGGVIIALVIGYLVYAGVRDTTVYYMTPTELLAKGEAVYGQGVRASGRIRDGSINWDPKTLELKFVLVDGKKSIPIHYQGVVPDTFKYGVDVVVEGKLVNDQLFEATMLLAKCPSKYEPEEG